MGVLEEDTKGKINSKKKKNNTVKKPSKSYLKEPRIIKPSNRKKCREESSCCKICGVKGVLSAHHISFKSERIDDSMGNLIALCFSCHRRAHDGYYVSILGKEKWISPRIFMIAALEKIDERKYDKALEKLRKMRNTDEV